MDDRYDEGQVTKLLEDLKEGNEEALNALFPLVYEHLRTLAHQQRQRWHGDYTLNTTALVHEAYLKLVDQDRPEWNNRAHFYSVAAKAMRHILINYAKLRRRKKRGGDQKRMPLNEQFIQISKAITLDDDRAESILLLDQALQRLETFSERQSRIVECRFFGGMTIADTARALDLSPATVKRDWAMAQAWLYKEMKLSGD